MVQTQAPWGGAILDLGVKWFWRRRFLNVLLFFLCISMVQTQAPWGGAILDLGVKWFWRRRFLNVFFFLCISMVQTQAPWGGAILDLGVTIRTNLAVLLTRYQASEPSNSRDEDILFSNPRPPQQGHLRPQGHYLNKQGRGPLDNASYQIPTITKCLVVSDVF